MDRLRDTLRRIDGKGYKAYKDISGVYRGEGIALRTDHVQGDPFAEPSRFALLRPVSAVGLPEDLLSPPHRRIAVEDFLARRVADALPRVCRGRRGTGGSGAVRVDRPGQEILERTSVLVRDGEVEVRLQVGLPAQGRRVLGREAWEMLAGELPRLAGEALARETFPVAALRTHVEACEDQQHARGVLAERGLVAFVREGAVLPRLSGVDPRPLTEGVVPFGPVPASLRVELELPHAGRVAGLGVPEGVTVVVGGGFHGKSTLLDALALGIYDHVPGDGREGVVTRQAAVTVRAEDGRRIEAVDISPFISHLPFGRDTSRFRTDDASGSTSQAAAIQEAVELGAEALLIDEDTSANNFLVRDFRMQELVHKDREPITPFIDRVRELWETCGVSTVLVLGGASDYLDVAHTVIQMDAYRPLDVTARAREICARHPNPRRREGEGALARPRPRVPLADSFDPSSGRRAERVRTRDTRAIQYGRAEIELGALEQVVDESQVRALGDRLVALSRGDADGRTTLADLVARFEREEASRGLAAVVRGGMGDRAAVRRFEVGAAVNRLRTLRVRDD